MRSSSRPMRLRRSPSPVSMRSPRARLAAEIPEPGIHAVAQIPVLGIHVGAQIPVLGIHVDSEIRDVAAQLLDVLARDAVQVEHEANDDGRGNPLEEFR